LFKKSNRQIHTNRKEPLEQTLILEVIFIALTLISYLVSNKTILCYGSSIFGGSVLLVWYLHFPMWFYENYADKKKDIEPEMIWWIPTLMGIIERSFITLIISKNVSGAGSFVIGWIVLKMALGWQSWGGKESTKYLRGVRLSALMVNLISAMIATVAGLALQNP
jgi:hypothetical protein